MPSKAWLKRSVLAAPILIALSVPGISASATVSDGFFTTSDNVKLHYLEAGKGETLLFVPGWLMPADIWNLQIRDLSKDYHVVALDPRSQGGSDMTPVGNDPMRRSKDIEELLEHLNVDSVVLVGWSLGAFDSLAYLRQFGTGKVNALVLVDSPLAAASGPAPAKRSAFLQGFQNDRDHIGPGYVESLFKNPLSDATLKKLVQAQARVPTDIALAALDNTRPGEAWGPNLKILREISLLYVYTSTYDSQAEYLQQVASQTRLEKFENCGHALFVDQSRHFNEILRNFLKQASFYPPGLPGPKTASRPAQPVQETSMQAAPATPPVSVQTSVPALRPTATHRAKRPAVPTFTPSSTFTAQPIPTSTPRPIRHKPTATLTPAPEAPISTPTPKPTRTPKARATPTPVPATTPNIPQPTPSLLPTPVQHARKPHRHAGKSLVHDGFFTTSDNVRLHYLEGGTGLSILFIPGWLLPAEIWRNQLEALAPDFHVVALDPRSQGQSDITPVGDEPVRQARDISELLDHLNIPSVALVGWSHGGFQVLSYIGQYGTDRLYAMALVDSALAPASSPTSTASRVRFLNQFKNNRVPTTQGFVWGLFKKPVDPEFLKALDESADRTPTDIALALMNNVFPGDSWMPSLPTMKQIPLLYAVTPKYSFQAGYITQVDPQATVEFFQNTGHALFVDDADHFNTTLRNFLEKSKAYPPGLPETKHKTNPTLGSAPVH